jgi:hypothetical protein
LSDEIGIALLLRRRERRNWPPAPENANFGRRRKCAARR